MKTFQNVHRMGVKNMIERFRSLQEGQEQGQFKRASAWIFQQLTANRLKRRALLYWAALLTVGSAAIHFMGVSVQAPQSGLLAALLIGYAIVQIVIALIVVAVPTRRLLIAVTVIESAALLLWIVAHTTGLPIGFPIGLTLWKPEMLSIFDHILPSMEGLAVLLLLCLVVRRPQMKVTRAWRTAVAMLPAFVLVSLLTLTGIINSAINDVWLPTSSTISAPAGQIITLAYCSPGGSPLAMDLSEPPTQAPHPASVVFNIHGGGGLFGSRQLMGLDVQLRDALNHRGFVVGSIDYRLSPLYSVIHLTLFVIARLAVYSFAARSGPSWLLLLVRPGERLARQAPM